MNEKLKSEISGAWRHKRTGAIYTVLAVANTAATRGDWLRIVVYRDAAGNIWARKVSEWAERYESAL